MGEKRNNELQTLVAIDRRKANKFQLMEKHKKNSPTPVHRKAGNNGS